MSLSKHQINSFLKLAFEIASVSTANKRKVGSVIVNDRFLQNPVILSTGFNKMPENFLSDCENNEGVTYDCVLHAEEVSILNLIKNNTKKQFDNLIMFATYSPCMNCAKLIVSAGIKTLYYSEQHKINFTESDLYGGISPKEFLENSEVKVVFIPKVDLQIDASENISFEPFIDTVKSETDVKLVYHSKDCDGLFSAYIATEYLTELNNIFNRNINIDLYPCNYEKDNKYILENYYGESFHYYFVDITPDIDWLSNVLLMTNHKIIIFDHHKEAINKIIDKFGPFIDSRIILITNMHSNDSAAKIIFDYLAYKEQNIFVNILELCGVNHIEIEALGKLVKIISDYDTWKFVSFSPLKEHETLVINRYFFTFTKNFTIFSRTVKNILNQMVLNFKNEGFDYLFDMPEIVHTGCDLLFLDKNDAEEKLNSVYFNPEKGIALFSGYTDYFIEKALSSRYGQELKFWISYRVNIESNLISFSIRSKGENDAQKFAQKFGGGGHLNASGFKINLNKFDLNISIIEGIKEKLEI
jgi:dCMP deaminase